MVWFGDALFRVFSVVRISENQCAASPHTKNTMTAKTRGSTAKNQIAAFAHGNLRASLSWAVLGFGPGMPENTGGAGMLDWLVQAVPFHHLRPSPPAGSGYQPGAGPGPPVLNTYLLESSTPGAQRRWQRSAGSKTPRSRSR